MKIKCEILVIGIMCLTLTFAELKEQALLYSKQEKTAELVAGGLAVFPGFGAGHLYAEDWDRSHPMLLMQGYGAFLLIANTSGYTKELIATGLIILGKAWESLDAMNTASTFNKIDYKLVLINQNPAKRPVLKVALGYGLPYGFGSGRNLGFFLSDNLEILLGLGEGSSYGIKYFLNKEVKQRQGMGLYVGLNNGSLFNSVSQYGSSSQYYIHQTGISFGVDAQIEKIFLNLAIIYQPHGNIEVVEADPGQTYIYPEAVSTVSYVFGIGIAL